MSEKLTEVEVDALDHGKCPDCQGGLLEGPQGGVSMNVKCKDCGASFNLIPGSAGSFGKERLSGPEKKDDESEDIDWCEAFRNMTKTADGLKAKLEAKKKECMSYEDEMGAVLPEDVSLKEYVDLLRKKITEGDERLRAADRNVGWLDRRILALKEQLAEKAKETHGYEEDLAKWQKGFEERVRTYKQRVAARQSTREPRPPLCVVHDIRYGGRVCPECRSDYPRRFWLVGRRYCVNDKCSLSRKNVPNIPDPPDLPREFDLEEEPFLTLPEDPSPEGGPVCEHCGAVTHPRYARVPNLCCWSCGQLLPKLSRWNSLHIYQTSCLVRKLREENEQLKCEAEIEEHEATARQLKLAAAELRADQLRKELGRALGDNSMLTTANDKAREDLSDAQLTAKRREHNRDEALACNRQLLEDVALAQDALKMYGCHKSGCGHFIHHMVDGTMPGCDCGFEKAQAGRSGT